MSLRQIFSKLDIRVGTVVKVSANAKARKPSYLVEVHFGPGFEHLNQRVSSAQLVELYTPETLLGKQLCAVANFPVRSVGVRSYFLTLGVVYEDGAFPTVVLVPTLQVPNGTRVGLLGEGEIPSEPQKEVAFEETLGQLDIRCGTVLAENAHADFGPDWGVIKLPVGTRDKVSEGMRILGLRNEGVLGLRGPDGREYPIVLDQRAPNGGRLG